MLAYTGLRLQPDRRQQIGEHGRTNRREGVYSSAKLRKRCEVTTGQEIRTEVNELRLDRGSEGFDGPGLTGVDDRHQAEAHGPVS